MPGALFAPAAHATRVSSSGSPPPLFFPSLLPTDPAGEYEEMRLKAAALLRAVGECDGSASPAAVEEG